MFSSKKGQLCVCLIIISVFLLLDACLIFVYFKYFVPLNGKGPVVPIVVTTWNYSTANDRAWDVIARNGTALHSVEMGIAQCEIEQCRHTVGYGGSPDEHGETTLDALLMDGSSMNVGAVGALRQVKSAVSVARFVLNYTSHSMLVGSQATDFALAMGFRAENLSTDYSLEIHRRWKENKCQPNYWQNVSPDPKNNCGPYHSIRYSLPRVKGSAASVNEIEMIDDENHDTIGMISVDHKGNVAAGTSTNGLTNKIPGRVGDSPIPGAGAFAESGIGAAVATGNGDIMMRFAPTAIAVELLRMGYSAQIAAQTVISRISKYYPEFQGAVVVATPYGDVAAACSGWNTFPYSVHARGSNMTIKTIRCSQYLH
ncbi:unnamed protein product [Bemisia tabaci]|uniref:N(4)-(beta-N-acetylglucosaminyl)-L-asparaginase n=1 Tax=Bemisia tabaci TaxID=7038 RepID=A0A9P0AF73_BEMTA|nr:unnamed protein product [Bemisia tabaci]